jgi:fructose 1,6-bisphosphatase
MSTKTTRNDDGKRPVIVGVRLTENEQARFRSTAKQIAIPFEIEDSKLVRTFALIGLTGFERNQQKKQKAQKTS